MKGPDGVQRWTTQQAVAQLGVDAARLRDWVRRAKLAGHVARRGPVECPACRHGPRPRFPHVEAPARAGRLAGYVAEQLMEAEAYTAAATRGGRIRAGT